jgi:hypothetical protein
MSCKDCNCSDDPLNLRVELYRDIMALLKQVQPGTHDPMVEFLKKRYGLSDLRLFSLSQVQDLERYLRFLVKLKRPEAL